MLHCFTRCRFATGWINSQGDTARWKSAMIPCRRENRSRSPYRILSPLFKISTGSKCFVALILPRLYSDNVFTGGWSLLACASLRVRRKRDLILPYPPSCLPFVRKKKDATFSFLFLLINGRRGEWRGGCLLSFSIRLIRMISFTVSVAWLGDFVIVVVYE